MYGSKAIVIRPVGVDRDMLMKSGNRRPVVIGTGLIALDLVISADSSAPIKDSAGGTCGNVLTILSSLDWQSYPIARLNGDAASMRVAQDLMHWGVQLNHAHQMPTTDTPIVIQKIRKTSGGESIHSFSWRCPTCKAWLPPYKPVTGASARNIISDLPKPDVFFFDRVSRGALILAEAAADNGAIIFFEPSAKGNQKQFKEALEIAHIVKYSDQRFSELPASESNLLQIQTLGSRGLRFKSTLSKAKITKWQTIDAIPAERVADTAGCGDWLTAGLILKLGIDGLKSFKKTSEKKLINALRFGQALSAWNCGFEGPRGGMCSDHPINISYPVGTWNHTEKIQIISTNINDAESRTVELSCPVCH